MHSNACGCRRPMLPPGGSQGIATFPWLLQSLPWCRLYSSSKPPVPLSLPWWGLQWLLPSCVAALTLATGRCGQPLTSGWKMPQFHSCGTLCTWRVSSTCTETSGGAFQCSEPSWMLGHLNGNGSGWGLCGNTGNRSSEPHVLWAASIESFCAPALWTCGGRGTFEDPCYLQVTLLLLW
jgi:hypothetical protein